MKNRTTLTNLSPIFLTQTVAQGEYAPDTNCEKYLLEILNESIWMGEKIGNCKFQYITEQSHGEPDFRALLPRGIEYSLDVKLILPSSQGNAIGQKALRNCYYAAGVVEQRPVKNAPQECKYTYIHP